MVTVVLDTTELRRDWMLTGLTMRLLGYASWHRFLDVRVPTVCVEELVAHHGRQVTEAHTLWERASQSYRRLGLEVPSAPAALDYRAYVETRLDEHLGFDIMPLPNVAHWELLRRAVGRIPPFDDRGSGYRDSLVWANVADLARAGTDVALVTADKIFRDDGGGLTALLQSDIEDAAGSVVIVQDLTRWLLEHLPWKSERASDAVATAQDEEFREYMMSSDFSDDVEPEAEDIGFDRAPFAFRVEEIAWAAEGVRVGEPKSGEGADVVEYDFDTLVTFEAILPSGAYVEEGWSLTRHGDRLRVSGQLRMTARALVLFGHDMGMQIDDPDWRRHDGGRRGPGVQPPAPAVALFDL
ncbi:PIN domain-containing protein [Curtobacterium sp. 9128]|uniref:PIN domain-containing protein n=1 Tax=Curtobacterium sp. 9128 TaxID=1793722 RepID=UPI00119EB18F|nr:PIN domain-containing protein [Curtobacterium sp. 9128]